MNSAPSFDQFLKIWLDANAELREVVLELTPSQLALPTGCSAWTVKDLIAHVIDIECLMAGQPPMNHEPDWESLPELGRSGRVTEIGVDGRRGRTLSELLTEFDAIIALRQNQLESGSHDLDSLVKGPTGTDWTLRKSFEMRINDTWVHVQDIRTAIDVPGGLDTPAAKISAESLFEMVPFAWAKTVQAPVGAVLEIRIVHPFETVVQVVIGDDGRAAITSGQEPTVLVTGDWGVLLPLLTGRSNDADLKAQLAVSGDSELADRLLINMSVTS